MSFSICTNDFVNNLNASAFNVLLLKITSNVAINLANIAYITVKILIKIM